MPRFSILKRLLTVLFSVLSLARSDAQSIHNLTRSQAVELALANNQSLQAARTLIEQAKARGEVAGRLENPELSFDYKTDWAFNDEGESSLGLGFSQRFPVTKRISILKDIAGIEIAMAEAEVLEQERLVAREVELLCNEFAYLESQQKLRASLLEIDKSFEAFVQSRIEVGEASPIDVNQIRIELYAIEQDINELKIAREKTRSRLRSLLGLEMEADLRISHSIDSSVVAGDLPRYGVESLDTHPQYRLQSLLLEVASKQSSLARASRWEDISIGVMLEQERSVDEPVGIGTGRFMGLAVSIPLPLRDRSRGLERESLSLQRQREAELAALSLELRNAAAALREEVMSLAEQASYYETNITPLVEQNLKEMTEAYSSGQISLNELFRSQSQRLKIQSTHLEMVRDYEHAMAEWKAATAQNL